MTERITEAELSDHLTVLSARKKFDPDRLYDDWEWEGRLIAEVRHLHEENQELRECIDILEDIDMQEGLEPGGY